MKAFYAGSFDPFTIGHESIAREALKIFGELIIGVGYNESKRGEYKVEERITHIQSLFKGEERVWVIGYMGLTTDAAREHGAGVLVRGVRSSLDFVKEKELADINLTEFGMPTVMIPSKPGLEFVSSSMVRELKHFGGDWEKYVARSPEGKMKV